MLILKGFRFGMLLQLAIGPMCLLVFHTAVKNGFMMAFVLVLAIAIVDGSYITLSGLGVAGLMKSNKVQMVLKLFGCLVLMVFGISMMVEAYIGYAIIPRISLLSGEQESNIFLKGLLLTASNPLTIIFWGGVLSTQVADHHYGKLQLLFFGMGCVLSTLVFLSAVALLGTCFSQFLPQHIITILNLFVGVLLVFFGVKILLKKNV